MNQQTMTQLADDAARGQFGCMPRASPVEVLHGLCQRFQQSGNENNHYQRGDTGQGDLLDERDGFHAFCVGFTLGIGCSFVFAWNK